MKKIYLMISLMAITYGNAQIQTQDFEASTLPADWTTNIVSGSVDWSFGSGTMPGGAAFSSNAAIFDDDAAGSSELNNTVQLLSPVVDLTGYADASLTFEYSMQAYITSGSLTVEAWNGTTWVQLLYVNSDTDPTVGVYDVTPYLNSAFQVRFTYEDGQDWAWGAGVDNFALTGTLSTNSYLLSKYNVSPNPTSDIVTINTNTELTNILVTDVNGKIIKKVANGNNKVDFSNLDSGVYFITYDTDDKHYLSKIVRK